MTGERLGQADASGTPTSSAAVDKAAENEGKKTATTYEESLVVSIERIRTTAKWLVGAFAAVGAVLIAGMSLSDLGDLDGLQAVLATVGAALGIGGIVAVISVAASVMSAGRIPMADLVGDKPRRRDIAERLARSRRLYQPYGSLTEFERELSAHWSRQAQAFIDYSNPEKSTEEREKAGDDFRAAGRYLKQFNPLNSRLLLTAEYENVRSRWDRGRRSIVIGVVAAAAGATLFAYTGAGGEDGDSGSKPAIAPTPARATLYLSDTGVGDFRDVLGEECERRKLPVIVLSKSEGSYQVVTDPDGANCSVALLDVSDEEGEIQGHGLGDELSGDLRQPDP